MSYNQFLRFLVFYFFVLVIPHFSLSQSIPLKNPSVLSFINVNPYSFQVNFTSVKDAAKYLVLFSEKGIPLATPQQNLTYSRGDLLYDSKVAYIGEDTFFIPSAVRINKTYHYVVYAFNGQAGNEKYQLSNPCYNKVTSKNSQIGSYYEEISSNSPNFSMQLHDLISPHNAIPYYNYKSTILEKIELKDTSKGMRYVECVYSGDKKVFSGNFDWTQLGFSREHTFPHSWMPTYPANNPEKPEYADLHNLYPTNLDKANTVRSNYPFGEINGRVLYEYKEGRLGEMDGVLVYEPSSKQKGNVARAIFYMLTAYNSLQTPWLLPDKQKEEILKKWHFQDLPDDYEKTRQEYIFDIQGNRNPFIDSVDFVCKIDFYKMIKSKKCVASFDEVSIDNLLSVQIDYEKNNFVILSDEDLKIELSSINGSKIANILLNTRISFLNGGIYFLKVRYKNQYFIKKIIF
jgi:hypothetical protein